MKALHTPLAIAALLATLTGSAMAQMGTDGMHRHDYRDGHQAMRMEKMHEHRQARHHQLLGELKTKLQLQPGQETAWKVFADAVQPPAQPAIKLERASMEKLSTPERIEQMRALHAQRSAEMKKRADATLAFYAGLNPDQKKSFDAETARFMGNGPLRGHH